MSERPLEGLRILELGSLIAGPFATRIMAEFGPRSSRWRVRTRRTL
jgi:formyl-CoA transferase